jgi:hypothetical protein
MTKYEKAAAAMKIFADAAKRDEEVAHIAADRHMIKILRAEGYGHMADIFEAMPKWYA